MKKPKSKVNKTIEEMNRAWLLRKPKGPAGATHPWRFKCNDPIPITWSRTR
jgi:hypothetical protein